MQLDSLTFDQLGFEGLNTQAVQGGCAVQQHGVLGDDLFEDVPDLGAETLDHALSRLDVLGVVEVHQALHDEGLEELQSHLLGQTTLVHLQGGATDDNGTTRVVNALTEQVLAEAALLTLEHVRE